MQQYCGVTWVRAGRVSGFYQRNGAIVENLKEDWQTIGRESPHQEGEVRSSSFLHFYKVIHVDFFFPFLRYVTAE